MLKFLGLDTSCYTTSLALIDEEGYLISDERLLLDVPVGEGGLRQGDGVFQHVQNIPVLVRRIFKGESIAAVCVSAKPRPVKESYMPVFSVGIALAESLASFNGMPIFYTSHQEGHIEAALWSSGFNPRGPFLGVHISGGTSEILFIEPQESGYDVSILGGTRDLHAGQLVDRIGVALGMKFPCGRELERLAATLEKEPALRLKGHVVESNFNFSGCETEAKKHLSLGANPAEISFAVFRVIANSLEKALIHAMEKTGIKDILLAGGVASNNLIKERLVKRLEHPSVGARLYFAKPEYATDNAVGTALIGKKFFSLAGNF